MTPLGEETLEDLNINTATDIVRAVPSLKMNAYSSSQVVFNIRGVAQNSYGDEQEPPVAVYQDDSYSSSINLASFPVFDLARVEALRGPQGTLFGRNATGGAIQFISNKPTKELDGHADGDLWQLQSADRRRSHIRPVLRPVAGTSCVHQQHRTTATSRRSVPARKTAAPTTTTRCAASLPGSRPKAPTST